MKKKQILKEILGRLDDLYELRTIEIESHLSENKRSESLGYAQIKNSGMFGNDLNYMTSLKDPDEIEKLESFLRGKINKPKKEKLYQFIGNEEDAVGYGWDVKPVPNRIYTKEQMISARGGIDGWCPEEFGLVRLNPDEWQYYVPHEKDESHNPNTRSYKIIKASKELIDAIDENHNRCDETYMFGDNSYVAEKIRHLRHLLK
jgi:hypothetical protein